MIVCNVLAYVIASLQSTVNDVLDLQAMTNGKFKLTLKPTSISKEVLVTLRRCRAYMSDDIRFQYRLPPDNVMIRVDMLRVSQILTNALR